MMGDMDREYRPGDRVRIIDPTRVVAFTRYPDLWTAGEYIVRDAGPSANARAEALDMVHIGPFGGPRVTFAIGTDNIRPSKGE
jgi:hypothetical protein